MNTLKKYFINIGWKRVIYMIIGVVFLGIGVACLRLSGFGTDPFGCMVFGLNNHLPISYGTIQILLNIVMFIPVVILYPKSFGIGAFVNMVGMGYVVEFCLFVCGLCNVTVESVQSMLVIRLFFLLAGIMIMCFGIALYMESDLGIAPYDMIAQLIEDKTHKKILFKWGRVTTDLLCIGVGFLLGGTVGIATVVVGFFTGPIVSGFRGYVKKKLMATT